MASENYKNRHSCSNAGVAAVVNRNNPRVSSEFEEAPSELLGPRMADLERS